MAGSSKGSEEGGFLSTHKYGLLVLTLLMLAFMIQQNQKYCLIATNNGMAQEIKYGDRECDVHNATAVRGQLGWNATDQQMTQYCRDNHNTECRDSDGPLCYWHYIGAGFEYQLLAGPIFTIFSVIAAIPMGLVSELNNINRKFFLSACVVMCSLSTGLGAFSTQYWHLAITRILLGFFSAAAVPFSASIISDFFEQKYRGGAMGFFNWGIFLGYSLSFVLIIAERELGWRAVYLITGIPGLVLGVLMIILIKEPERSGGEDQKALSHISNRLGKLKTAATHFVDPILFMVCLAGAIRNGAGVVWAYNIRNFFAQYHPGTNTEEWMSWIPLIFGSLGAFGGGALSDKLSRKRGTKGRLLVLIGCISLSAPFQVGTLYLPMPWAFISHIPAYLIGEMWIGVCVAIILDLVPSDLTTSAVSIYFFIIQIIGGNMNLFVTPIRNALELRIALLITFPGMYILGAILFTVTFGLVVCLKKNTYDLDKTEGFITKEVGLVDLDSGKEGIDNPVVLEVENEIDEKKVKENSSL